MRHGGVKAWKVERMTLSLQVVVVGGVRIKDNAKL